MTDVISIRDFRRMVDMPFVVRAGRYLAGQPQLPGMLIDCRSFDTLREAEYALATGIVKTRPDFPKLIIDMSEGVEK